MTMYNNGENTMQNNSDLVGIMGLGLLFLAIAINMTYYVIQSKRRKRDMNRFMNDHIFTRKQAN